MATLGTMSSTGSTPGGGSFTDSFTNAEWWDGGHTMPAGGGIVTSLSVYCAGFGGSVTAQLVIWGATAILWQSGNFTLGSSLGWVTKSVPSIYVPAGTVNLGFWSSGDVQWIGTGSGVTFTKRSVAGGPAALSGSTSESTAIGTVMVYTPGGIAHVRRSGTWQTGTVQVRRSGVWTPGRVLVRRSGAWVDAS